MNVKYLLATATALAGAVMTAPAAHADTLAPPAQPRATAGVLPQRGLSMAQVERRYGAPQEKLPTAGGDAPRHPPIHRWRYAGYTVYFERNRVIHSVPDALAATPPSESP